MKKLSFLATLISVWGCNEEQQEPSIEETMKTYTNAQMMDN